MSPLRPSARRGARGFTLIEVLVAIVIFSIGVIGIVGMQARLLQASTQNGDRARAAMLANEIASTMWAQQTVALGPADIAAWQSRVSDATKSGLPNGSGSVTWSTSTSGITTAAITVSWTPPSAAAGATANQFVTTMVIQ
jgi:type IV pilus assembly protein PilV